MGVPTVRHHLLQPVGSGVFPCLAVVVSAMPYNPNVLDVACNPGYCTPQSWCGEGSCCLRTASLLCITALLLFQASCVPQAFINKHVHSGLASWLVVASLVR